MDNDIRNIKRDLRKLLRSQPLAVLTTQNQGQPYASLIAFASSDDLKSFYFATTRSTRKYANLSGDSQCPEESVERRGGMLIHGAIIAREYGIPCVTGVPDAFNQIRTGDFTTVDGHLGIVIIGEASL